jgi:hypothetical protein
MLIAQVHADNEDEAREFVTKQFEQYSNFEILSVEKTDLTDVHTVPEGVEPPEQTKPTLN